MSEAYRVRVTKDHLVFSAAHFVTIGSFCERLHGHNWRVAAEVSGPLDENSFVVDFLALRDCLQEIVSGLDHRMLLPTLHPRIRVEAGEKEVDVRFEERRWVFPLEECVLLPIEQTTAELLARWIGEQVIEMLASDEIVPQTIEVHVEENFGQWAVWRRTLDSGASG
jgi:6-pyruvoyltetrahydropterin/6-carboxytetrahydropterin synthase